MDETRTLDSRYRGVPPHERHFYAITRAFGRFGMRTFAPTIMDAPHWHGHVEANLILGGSMTYDVDGDRVEIPEGRLVLFWAGVPHQLTDLHPSGGDPMALTNLYIPVDAFLFMPHIGQLQVALLGGALIGLPTGMSAKLLVSRWYSDYQSGDFERMEVMKMELNALLRRAQAQGIDYLREPLAEPGQGRLLSSAHIGQVVEMVRYILENLDQPLTNADVAEVTGLHQNYALSLFSRTMRMPMKRFIIRMRLLRARAMLMESTKAIATVAEASGFSSLSQFYDHFKRAYGISPNQMRARYTRMELR